MVRVRLHALGVTSPARLRRLAKSSLAVGRRKDTAIRICVPAGLDLSFPEPTPESSPDEQPPDDAVLGPALDTTWLSGGNRLEVAADARRTEQCAAELHDSFSTGRG